MTDVVKIAAAFARAIVAGDEITAHEMLSNELGAEVAPTDLSSQFEPLAEDMGGVTGIGQPMVILEEWPEKAADDRAMVYVPLEGDVFSEAITVTVSEIENALRISSIEWGRP